MTITEKMEMYRTKKAFVNDLSKAFEGKSVNSSVTRIDYEVYHKEVTRNDMVYQHYVEFVIVRFEGGAMSTKVVSGNSNTANFTVIGSLLNGGDYDTNPYYFTMAENGYKLIPLTGEDKLKEALSKPMEHIRDVRNCFDLCSNGADVEKVIRMIPNCFGTFEVEYSEDEETFTIINYYEENGVEECDEIEYDFYKED
jgi:hypothetical protein